MEEQITAVKKIIDTIIEFSVNYSFQVLGAVLILIVGALIANWVYRAMLKVFERKNLDITLSKFLASVLRILVLTFALIIALGKFGITIAPFIAALSALAFGASFAIQGPLSNYGAGLSIILTRPFVVGDTITIAGVSGVVQEVTLACTILTNEDGVKITIPNKHIVGETLYNSKKNSIVEAVIGISYDSNPELAIRLIQEVLQKSVDVVKEPLAQVGIKEFADSSINIGYRYWVPTVKFFQTSGRVNLAVFKILEEKGIKIPFPQREVRVLSQTSNISS